jgi:hypothetical protein
VLTLYNIGSAKNRAINLASDNLFFLKKHSCELYGTRVEWRFRKRIIYKFTTLTNNKLDTY